LNPSRTRAAPELVAGSADDVPSWLPGGGSDEQVLHPVPTPTLLRVEIPPRTEPPAARPPDPACVAVLRVRETNTFHRADGPVATRVAEIETATGDVPPMDQHLVHPITNRTAGPAVALHVHPGRFVRTVTQDL
jgi:hypothetical protein